MSYFATLNQLPPVLDAFTRLRVSEPESVFGSKLLYDNAPTLWDDQQLSGAGTTSTYNTNQASVTLAVSNLTAGVRARQTFRRFGYQPGKGQLLCMTGILGAPAAGITRQIGVFDDQNGAFFQSAPATVNVGIRSFTSGSAVDTLVPQSAWNVDKFDGTGPSGITLDFSKAQIFAIDFQWLGTGITRFGFFLNASFYVAHEFFHANLVTLVYMSIPNLPLRYQIANDGTGGAASMLQICSSVIAEGGQQFTGQERAVARTTGLTTNNDANLYPILAIRIQAGKMATTVRLTNFSALSTTATTAIEVQLMLNPVVTGTALSFSAVASSNVEAATGATNATTVSGGTVLAATVGFSNASFVTLDDPTNFQLGSSIAGVSDVVVLAGRRLTGSTETLFGTMGWTEDV